MAKKKLRLKYRLEPIGETGLEFQVLEMDEKFRVNYEENKEFIASNGVRVISDDCAEIWKTEFTIFLRGKKKYYDKRVHKSIFKTLLHRRDAINKIHFALKEWSVKWFKKEGK